MLILYMINLGLVHSLIPNTIYSLQTQAFPEVIPEYRAKNKYRALTVKYQTHLFNLFRKKDRKHLMHRLLKQKKGGGEMGGILKVSKSEETQIFNSFIHPKGVKSNIIVESV